MPPIAKPASGTRGQIAQLRAEIDALLAARPRPQGQPKRLDAANLAEDLTSQVRRHPLIAIGLALLAGFIAGKLA